MADMFDCGFYEFNSWARETPHAIRWYGAFDATRTAEQQWVINDCDGKLCPSAFGPFKRGWEAAQQQYLSKNNGN